MPNLGHMTVRISPSIPKVSTRLIDTSIQSNDKAIEPIFLCQFY